MEISNRVAFGLVTSVFTTDLDTALTVVDGLETGMIRVNMPTSGVDFHAPFGGEKQSSFGPREQGKAARELYTTTHTITIGPRRLMAIWRVQTAEGERLARGPVEGGPVELLDGDARRAARGRARWTRRPTGPVPAGSVVLAPVAGQEVWAAGVTYAASRSARNDESKGAHDFYDKVYDAERPELFFKAAPGPGARAGRRGSACARTRAGTCPEPELALVDLRRAARSSATRSATTSRRARSRARTRSTCRRRRSTAGRARSARASCRSTRRRPADALEISLTISRDGEAVFTGSTQTALLKRGLPELVSWLFRAQDFPVGAVLLTGTSVIPAIEFTLQGGDEVRIAITGLGELVNTVEVV